MTKNLGQILAFLVPVILTCIVAIFGGVSTEYIKEIFNPAFFRVFFLVILVQILAHSFKYSHFDKDLLRFLRAVTKDMRTALFLLPAIFGLLPMPAGAMMTATLSDTTGDIIGIKNKLKFFFNYWFRHIWEFSWPLYPAIIIASGFSHIKISQFILKQSIFLFISIIIGLIMLHILIPSKKYSIYHEREENDQWFKLSIHALWPIFFLIVLILVLKVSSLVALSLTTILFILWKRISGKRIIEILKKSLISRTTFLILVILIFKGAIEHTTFLNSFVKFFEKRTSPLFAITTLPFSVGFVTGLTQAAVGVTFPFLMPLFSQYKPFAYIAYVSGFMGVMLSPFHLCLITTKEYYRVSMKEVYSMLIIPVIIIEFSAILITRLI